MVDVDKKLQHVIKNCGICQTTKIVNCKNLHHFGTQKPEEVTSAFRSINVDIMKYTPGEQSSSSHNQILVVLDCFSRFMILIPLMTMNMLETKAELVKVFGQFGNPKYLLVDGGGEYALINNYCKDKGIVLRETSPYNHKANGANERSHRFIRQQLDSRVEELFKTMDLDEIMNEWN